MKSYQVVFTSRKVQGYNHGHLIEHNISIFFRNILINDLATKLSCADRYRLIGGFDSGQGYLER